MNILLIGSGGREHALAWKMAASTELTKLWCAPGNAGIAREAECIALDVADHAAVVTFCKANKVDLVVVGPEVALCDGVADRVTFIVDPNNEIQFVSATAGSVGRNVDEVLRVLDALQSDELCACNWRKGDPTLNAGELLKKSA